MRKTNPNKTTPRSSGTGYIASTTHFISFAYLNTLLVVYTQAMSQYIVVTANLVQNSLNHSIHDLLTSTSAAN